MPVPLMQCSKKSLGFAIFRAGRKVSRRRLPEFIGGGPATIALLQNIEQR
jgi:hypothetical protein